jgi:hypothetical protein
MQMPVTLFFTASLALAPVTATLPTELGGKIDVAVREVLPATGVPSASVAIVLKNGLASNYGLGLSVERVLSRRLVAHDGMISGFVAQNRVLPDDRVAVAVLTNGEADAARGIVERIGRLLFPEEDAAKEEQQARPAVVRRVLRSWRLP